MHINMFRNSSLINDTTINAEARVESKYQIGFDMKVNTFFHEERLIRYITKLKSGCAYRVDGILSEYLKYAVHCEILIKKLCGMFTLCLKFGIVPDSFTWGILIPLLKKANLCPLYT